VPILRERLWIPPLQGRYFKEESYLDGRDWLARNDGASQRMVFRMRLVVGLLAWGLALRAFFAAREWFGSGAALIALTLLVFDPDVMAHSALVTTDIGVSLFFLATIYAFYRYVTRPSVVRLLVAGVITGLLAATKHSGILLLPMLLPVLLYEAARAERGMRLRQAVRLCGALAGMVVIATVVLWAFYGFRYAARPAGLTLNPTFAQPFRYACIARGCAHTSAAGVVPDGSGRRETHGGVLSGLHLRQGPRARRVVLLSRGHSH
jgi:4-amino-4-deoxy-L-arabinose transferase-like glycosyltransferase